MQLLNILEDVFVVEVKDLRFIILKHKRCNTRQQYRERMDGLNSEGCCWVGKAVSCQTSWKDSIE